MPTPEPGRATAPTAPAAVYGASADAYRRYWAPVLDPHTQALLAALPAGQDRTVLDIGAGAGTLAPAPRAAGGAPRQAVSRVAPGR
ncbi:hypothetical protein BKA01_003033 [Pseudonocardia eucalypti]|nr:hypothetical protein [Pseudonocardia eucalypti]